MKEQIRQPVEDVWRNHCAALDDALSQVIRELQNLLRVDEYHRHGHDPDQLERALGPLAAANLDVGSLSRVLEQSTPPRAMEPERLKRVEGLITALTEMKEAWSSAPLDDALMVIEGDENGVRRRAEAHLTKLARVFGALRAAQLEVRSKYDANTHDATFAGFDWRQLGPGELRLSPPFVVVARLDGDSGTRLHEIMSLLETGMPIKIIAIRSGLREHYPGTTGTSVPSKMTIETLPLAMRGVYFVQRSSVATDFQEQLSAALTSPRAAVISLLCQRDDETLEAFQSRAEAAVRARAFPACAYDPDRDARFVMCFDLSSNPSPETLWTTEKLSGLDAQGEAIDIEEPFTVAHFAAGEPDLAAELTDPSALGEILVPLTDYLGFSRRQQVGKRPFISLAGPDGSIVRKVVSPQIARQCAERQHLWRSLQELSGIDNPHVISARATLQKELEAEQRAQLESMQRDLSKSAAEREKAAVVSTVRKLVARLAGIDPSGN